jgi:hypothetical protein
MLAAVIATITLSGCAAGSRWTAKNFRTELVPSSKIYFSQVRTTEERDGFKVSGKIRLKGSSAANLPDYIEVTLTDTAGNAVATRKVPYSGVLVGSSRRHREASFSALFAEVPPQGTVIRLSNVN